MLTGINPSYESESRIFLALTDTIRLKEAWLSNVVQATPIVPYRKYPRKWQGIEINITMPEYFNKKPKSPVRFKILMYGLKINDKIADNANMSKTK